MSSGRLPSNPSIQASSSQPRQSRLHPERTFGRRMGLQGVAFGLQFLGFGVLSFRVRNLGLRVQCLGLRVHNGRGQGSVWDLEFEIWDSGLEVRGLGLMACLLGSS